MWSTFCTRTLLVDIKLVTITLWAQLKSKAPPHLKNNSHICKGNNTLCLSQYFRERGRCAGVKGIACDLVAYYSNLACLFAWGKLVSFYSNRGLYLPRSQESLGNRSPLLRSKLSCACKLVKLSKLVKIF